MYRSRAHARDADLRDYARWEYGRNDVAWLYAYAAARRRRNYVHTDRDWLDSDNHRDHSRWNGHVGRAGRF